MEEEKKDRGDKDTMDLDIEKFEKELKDFEKDWEKFKDKSKSEWDRLEKHIDEKKK